MRDWRQHYEVRLHHTCTPHGCVRRLTVKKRSGKDGIGWDVLMRIKDDVLGPEVYAVEVYPPASEVVNEVNMRHLWEVPEGLQLFNLHRR